MARCAHTNSGGKVLGEDLEQYFSAQVTSMPHPIPPPPREILQCVETFFVVTLVENTTGIKW